MVITNREVMLEKLNSDIKFLAESLIKTELVNNGDYSYDRVDEYWVDNYEQQFISPNGDVYSEYCYDECLKDTIKWLNKESEN